MPKESLNITESGKSDRLLLNGNNKRSGVTRVRSQLPDESSMYKKLVTKHMTLDKFAAYGFCNGKWREFL